MCWHTDSSPVKSSVVTRTTEAPRATTSRQFAPGGAVALPARVALGCRVIQLHYGVIDREVVSLVQESPYLQYFLGFEKFSDSVPFSARTVARFRARIPDKAVRPAVRLLRSYR